MQGNPATYMVALLRQAMGLPSHIPLPVSIAVYVMLLATLLGLCIWAFERVEAA